MRFPIDCQVFKACSQEAGHLSITGALLDVEKKTLTATNGRILISLPIEIDDGDITGIIPGDALKEAIKLARSRHYRELGVVVQTVKTPEGRNVARLLDKREFPMMDAASFPRWEQVLPDFAGKRTVRLSFNPALLMALAESIGLDPKDKTTWPTTLEFGIGAEDDQDGKPVRVSAGGAPVGTIAVLMPVKTVSRAPNRVDDIEKAHAEAVEASLKPCEKCDVAPGHCLHPVAGGK